MKNKFTRRRFVKVATGATIGSSVISSPLSVFAKNEDNSIIFIKYSTNSADHFYVFPPNKEAGETSIFIYTDSTFKEQQFDISKAFTDYSCNFLIGIYKRQLNGKPNQPPFPDPSFKNFVQQEINVSNRTIRFRWFHSFNLRQRQKSTIIQLNDNRLVLGRFIFGSTDKPGKVELSVSNQFTAKTSFNSITNSITIEAEDASLFSLTHNSAKATATKIEIPIANSDKFDNQKTLVSQNLGSIRFRTNNFPNQVIKPFSPYIIDAGSQKKILKVDYFEENSYKENVDLLVTLYPFIADFKNDTSTPTYLEIINRTGRPVLFNSVDNFGKRYIVNDFSEFLCKMVQVEFDSNPQFLFVPFNKLRILNEDDHSQILLGYSGTERTDVNHNAEELIFIPSEYLYAKHKALEKSPIVHEKQTDSRTSKIWIKSNSYYVDADKSPLFKNNQNPSDDISKSIAYESILFGLIGDSLVINNSGTQIFADAILKAYKGKEKELETKLISSIPFFSFKNTDPDLTDNSIQLEHFLEIEKIFSNYRKQGLTAINIPQNKHITPQGFLRVNDKFDYIPIKPNSKIEVKTTTSVVNNSSDKNFQSQLRFSINKIDADFNLSLSKEDVFFVTTPTLMQQAATNVELDIFFSICGFDVDLIFKNAPKKDDERIIIFKFSKHSVEELCDDVYKWSNWNKYSRPDFTPLQQTIQQKLKRFNDRYENNGLEKNPDYYYIDQVVRLDKNWNGIIILDVPIKTQDLPPIFTGLCSSQELQPNFNPVRATDKLLQFKQGMKFEYIAFPVNKTRVTSGRVEISSTSFFGLIDYDLLKQERGIDYKTVSNYFPTNKTELKNYRFVLTKLLVRFENSEIRNFDSFAFLQVPNLFDNTVTFDNVILTHPDNLNGDSKPNLIRLNGSYQKNSDGTDQFTFNAEGEIKIKFDDGNILEYIEVDKISFNYVVGNTFRFDIDANAHFNPDLNELKSFLSFDSLRFGNIGLQFDIESLKLPKIHFDLSKLFVFPKISFNCNGFLSSFPIKFSHFELFKLRKIGNPGNFKLQFPDFDFFNVKFNPPNVDIGEIGRPDFQLPNLFSFVFDLDLGTLGDLSFLKALKGQFLFGWSPKGGFSIGFKINGSYNGGFHLNLFGALKLDIEQLEICTVNGTSQYLVILKDVHLNILGLQLPPGKNTFNGLLFANPGNKLAWLITYLDGDGKLTFGIGQRVSVPELESVTTVDDALLHVKRIFDKNLNQCPLEQLPGFYQPNCNWLVASENIIPDSLASIIDIKFIFNDPILYGIFLKLVGLFSIDVLYKKLSDDLGVWSLEFALDPSLRTIDAGELVITLPNLGIDISTNGDWKLDVGFPKGNDWTRSCLAQLRPFVGWCGMYIARLKTASLSLFGPYDALLPHKDGKLDVTIFQAGFAIRVGIGAYIDKGIFYVGASISVYGILEGAFGFNKSGGNALQQLLPDHFVLAGRVGAIAELVGYVDFKIVKASIHIVLRVEVGLTLAYISYSGTGQNTGYGLQPVPLYIEGEVTVEIDFTICCFSVFGHHICITIHLSFHAYVRFAYTIGGNGANSLTAFDLPEQIVVDGINEIPVILIPAFTQADEGSTHHFIVTFAIPFFGFEVKNDDGKPTLSIGASNVIKDNILMPLFAAIYKGCGRENSTMTYNELRSVLKGQVDGDSKKEVKFSFPKFTPVFLKGFDRNSMTEEDFLIFLKTYFLIEGEEAKAYVQNSKADVCANDPSNCLYKPVPIPIPKRLKIIENSQNVSSTDFLNGFSIKVKNISEDDIPEIDILPDLKYSNSQLDKFNDDLKNYKTQKDNFKNNNSAGNDLREDAIIPEYFKLFGLLMIEAYYNFLNRHANAQRGQSESQLNATETTINPSIKLSDLFDIPAVTDNTGWNLNQAIPDILGQLNYSYNNGQRIVDFDNGYKPYYEVLKQTSNFNRNLIDTNFADASISIFDKAAGGAINQLVELRDELFKPGNLTTAEDNFKEFIKRSNNLLNIKSADLQQQFLDINNNAFINFINPYDLVAVKLQLLNSRIISAGNNNDPNKFRFFEIPQKIRTQFKPSEKYSASLFLGKTSTTSNNLYPELEKDDISINANVNACVNINLNVKLYQNDESEVVAMELADVNIDDLILINAIFKYFTETDYNSSINLYIKTEDDEKILVSLFDADDSKNIAIVKTNLSPKSFPPIIFQPNHFQDIPEDPASKFYANLSEDKRNFISIFREGMITNNGGFYFVRKDKQKFVSMKGEAAKLILSVEAGIDQPIFGFANFFKIVNGDVVTGKKIFGQLESNNYYLYLDLFENDGKTSVLEYHSKIPAHCMSFEIKRNLPALNPSANLNPKQFYHYIPIDFSLKEDGSKLIDEDEVIPIMPKTKGNEPYAFYNHITPLVNYNDDNVLNRYSVVGKKFKLNFSLRDIYGFRTTGILTETIYTHSYFDKLIPVSSFPFVKFSYWYDEKNKIDANFSNWVLKFELNTDEATINKLTSDAETKCSTLETLYSIKAQLSDANLELYILNGNADSSKNEFQNIDFKDSNPKDKLKNIVDAAISIAKGDSRNNLVVTLDFQIPIAGFKAMLNPYFIQRRNVADNLFTDKSKMADVWDYEQIIYTKEKIVLVNIDAVQSGDENHKLENSLAVLNNIIDPPLGDSDYTLGVGVLDESLERCIFLIKKNLIKTIKPKDESLSPDNNFFGIKPYSTSLWSGSYNNQNSNDARLDYNFSDIDLDHSLKLVLAKIDEFLTPFNIVNLDQSDLNMLIECKQKLVKGTSQIADLADDYSELAYKVENINHPGLFQLIEFENLLLDSLKNFYNYDGIINCKIVSNHELIGHRLKVDINISDDKENSKYQIQSSKLFFKTTDDIDWTLLFDYLPNNFGKDYISAYSFKANAVVTHIEFDIVSDGNGIEKSQWIQLLSPIKLTEPLSIDNFPSIIREYPPKPLIVLNDTRQCKNEDVRLSWSYDLGNWQFLLGISDLTSLIINDKINIKLNLFSHTEIQKFAPDDFRNFEGFISYWTQIAAGDKYFMDINKSEFIKGLAMELKKAVNKSPAITPKEEIPNFTFKKTGDSQWVLASSNSNPEIYLIDEKDIEKNNPPRILQDKLIKDIRKLIFHGPNVLFQKNKKPIVSIKPDVWITRNDSDKIGNFNFKYRTAVVSPSTWTTVHLRYNNAIFVESDKLQDVLNSIVDENKKVYLPTKSTIKHELDADDLESKRDLALPGIPIKQIELNEKANIPTNVDALFEHYKNGYPAISLTISNFDSQDDNNLAILLCYTIFKKLKL